MKKLFILAALLTVGAYSASAQTTTTTTTKRTTTTAPAAMDAAPTSTTSESTTTTTDQAPMGVPVRTKRGNVVVVPEGAKVKSNGKKLKVK